MLAWSLHSCEFEFLRKISNLGEGDLPRASQSRLSQDMEVSNTEELSRSITEESWEEEFSVVWESLAKSFCSFVSCILSELYEES